MSSINQKLFTLSEKAKKDPKLRKALLDTRKASDPMDAFCQLSIQAGCPISIGELFSVGQENSDNQCKSTNGGNPTPYDSFEDAYEIFLSELEYAVDK